MLQFIRLRPGGDFWVGAGFISDHRKIHRTVAPKRFSRGNSVAISLTFVLLLSRMLDMSSTYGVSLTWAL